MFNQKPVVKNDNNQIREISSTMVDLKRRLKDAEQQNKTFISQTEGMESDLNEQDARIDNQINLINAELSSIKKEIKNTIGFMSTFVKLLRLKAKKREMDLLNDKVNQFNPEKFITKSSFSSMLKKD